MTQNSLYGYKLFCASCCFFFSFMLSIQQYFQCRECIKIICLWENCGIYIQFYYHIYLYGRFWNIFLNFISEKILSLYFSVCLFVHSRCKFVSYRVIPTYTKAKLSPLRRMLCCKYFKAFEWHLYGFYYVREKTLPFVTGEITPPYIYGIFVSKMYILVM